MNKLENLRAPTVRDLLADPAALPAEVYRALELRAHAAKAAAKKFKAMLKVASPRGRLEQMLIYWGAGPGRASSQGGINLQNLARGIINDVDAALADVLAGMDDDTMEIVYGEPLSVYSSLVRSCLVPSPGHVFIDADFSSVENRVAAWIADDRKTVELFRNGLDQYVAFAAEMYGVPADKVTKKQRQVAKSAVLGCVYGQGFKGYIEYAATFGVIVDKAEAKRIVGAFRRTYAKVKHLWRLMGEASVKALQTPDEVVQVNAHVSFVYDTAHNLLRLRLPSGRYISFFQPELARHAMRKRKGDPEAEWQVVSDPQDPQVWDYWETDVVTAMGIDTATRQWKRNQLPGYKFFQNAVQGTAYDLLANAMRNIEQAGFDIVLTVHDEILADVPVHKASLSRFIEAMTTLPNWAKGLPLAADGWVGPRFKK